MPEESTENNQLIVYAPSESRALASALGSLTASLHEAARQSILSTIGPADGYTETEIQAMIALEQLRLVNGFDLAAILERGKLIREIEDRGLWARHPNGFQTMEEAAAAQGISQSEYSNIRDLTQVIFPFLVETLGLELAAVWDHVRKANFREMVPVMKAIITGQVPNSPSTRASVERLLAETGEAMRLTAEQRGADAPTADAIRDQVVSDLLLAGEQMSNRDLRAHLRQGPARRTIQPAVVRNGERYHFVVTLDEDQYEALLRKLGSFAETPLLANLPEDPTARQREAARIRALRDIVNLVNGG